MKKAIGYVYVIAAAVCWGFLGLFNRVLTAGGVSLLNMMPLRFGGTAILFTVFCMMFKQQVFHIKLRHLPIFLGSGLISMLLVLCGCALVSGIVGSDVGISLEGLLMGLASELCYPDMDKFIEMCFDPGSPINERLKETLREMLKEEEK